MTNRGLSTRSPATECEPVTAHFEMLDVDVETFRQIFPLTCPKVAQRVTQLPFEADCRLTPPVDGQRSLFLVAAGSVREEVTFVDGRRQISRFLFRGDRVFDFKDTRHVQYIAMDTGMLYRIPLSALKNCECAKSSPEEWLGREYHQRIDSFAQHAVLLGSYTATEKVAAFLLELAKKLKNDDDAHPIIRLPMRRDDIADYLGLKAETVSRQLTRLRKDGVLGLPKPGEVIVRDMNRLEALIPTVAEAEE